MSSTGRQALFRISQNLPRHLRKNAVIKARKHLDKRWKSPLEPKMMGFVSETKSLDIIPECLLCGHKYLHYSFLDYLLGNYEKSWNDIECLNCREFIVEVKSTKQKNPERLYGGSYPYYQKLFVKPYLLVFSGFYIDKNGIYQHNKPTLYEPGFYQVIPRKENKKSFILLSDK